ncbi:MAG: hypothetical protein CMF04_07940 [Hyphomonas sp.]|nr:hypothetical protein [Hyphomonas sp.]
MGGKSNFIDTVRLVSTPLSGRRDLHRKQIDIRFGTATRAFDILLPVSSDMLQPHHYQCRKESCRR